MARMISRRESNEMRIEIEDSEISAALAILRTARDGGNLHSMAKQQEPITSYFPLSSAQTAERLA
jgi:hypothetical protein